jgi:hypothetical protein
LGFTRTGSNPVLSVTSFLPLFVVINEIFALQKHARVGPMVFLTFFHATELLMNFSQKHPIYILTFMEHSD